MISFTIVVAVFVAIVFVLVFSAEIKPKEKNRDEKRKEPEAHPQPTTPPPAEVPRPTADSTTTDSGGYYEPASEFDLVSLIATLAVGSLVLYLIVRFVPKILSALGSLFNNLG